MASERVCFGPSWIDDLVSAVISGVSLVFSLCIGLMARYRFQRSDPKKVHRASKIVIFAAVCFSSIQSVAGIGQNAVCTVTGYEVKFALIVLSYFGYWATMQCVVVILILRLDATFRDSPFPLPALKRNAMLSVFLTVQILWIFEVVFTVHAVIEAHRDIEEPFVLPLWIWASYAVTLALFVALCIATVISFCDRLLSTAKALSKWTEGHRLEAKQREIVDVSAKYLTLFLVAMLSAMLQFAISSLLNFSGHDPSVLLGADCIANLQCLYLQSEFASKHYANHCRKIDVFCRWTLSWRLKNHDEAVRARRATMCRGLEVSRRESAGDKEFEIGIPPTMNFESSTNTDSKRLSAYVPSIEDSVDRRPTSIRLHPPKRSYLVTILGLSVRTGILSPPGQPEPADEAMTPNESACAKDATTPNEEQSATDCSVSSERAEPAEMEVMEHTAKCTECPLSLGERDGDEFPPSGRSPQTKTAERSPSQPTRCMFSMTVTTFSGDEATRPSSTSDPSWCSVAL